MYNNEIKPQTYKRNVNGVDIDVFDIAQAYNLNIREFSALKYILRRKDNRKQDVMKAIECLNREIKFLEQ